jgi:hypothetical protein
MSETLCPYRSGLDRMGLDAPGQYVSHLKTGDPQGSASSNLAPSASRHLPAPFGLRQVPGRLQIHPELG